MSAGIRVWAPLAGRVEVVSGARRTTMTAMPGGWFAAPRATAGHDGRYLLSVNGGEPMPDPRSAHQPDGVHGHSVLVDHSAFAWTDSGWRGLPLRDAVIYELHIGTFSEIGTFDAAITKLPHLVELGINAVDLMPVATFPGSRGWGYDGVDLYAPHPAYGGPEGLKRFVDACHAQGIAVVLDVVYNHLGPDGNYLGAFGPYFTNAYATPWGSAMNFDGRGSDEVRRFFVDNALTWLRDYHCDGLRLDAVHAIIDTSALHFLEQVAAEVRELGVKTGRELWLIAESDLNDPRVVSPAARGGYGFDAQWSDDFHHALHAVLTGEGGGYYADFGRLADLSTALRQAFVYDGRHSQFRERSHGRRPQEIPGWAFLGYIQDHDQVGNRAAGERISQLVSPGLARVAAALVLLSPFTPMLFAGEEWGAATPFLYFTDHQDEKLGRAVTEGRRREFAAFGWQEDSVPNPQAADTFEASRLRWDEPGTEPHMATLKWYQALLRLRSNSPALRDGRLDLVAVDHDEDARWLVMRRGEIELYCNFSGRPIRLPASGEVILASEEGTRLDGSGIELPPESAAVLRNTG
ncbi:MAG: malto-oligosyltrehalose trehalohydrolase [Candidatus Dormibacteria bacterium]